MLALLSEGLESAFSTSGEVRKRGEGILRELETQPGYLSSLLQVALSNNASTLSSGVQDLSGITFKHGCAKLWRQVTEEEKAFVKSQLLEHLDEIGSEGALTACGHCCCDNSAPWPIASEENLNGLSKVI